MKIKLVMELGVGVDEARASLEKLGKIVSCELIEHPVTKKVAKVTPKKETVSIEIMPGVMIPLSKNILQLWTQTYPKEMLETELKKARAWLVINPHKAPKKNFERFLNSWFSRAFDQYRKTLASNKSPKLTLEDMNFFEGE